MRPDEKHGHDHAHHHGHQEVPPDTALRVKALESLLVEKGLVDPAALDAIIDTYENKVGPKNGAQVVARAWSDPAYKERLMRDATAAVAELGYTSRQGEHMVVVENTPQVHNLVVCTLCSCYPWPVLGLPPIWYKSSPYRSRAVADRRGVLREFGLELYPHSHRMSRPLGVTRRRGCRGKAIRPKMWGEQGSEGGFYLLAVSTLQISEPHERRDHDHR